MNATLTFSQPKNGIMRNQTPSTRLDEVLSVFLHLAGTKADVEGTGMAKVFNISGNKWFCDSFDTDNGIVHLKEPIEVTIEPIDEYLKASFDVLGIAVLEKNIDDLKDYFQEALMCDYYAYTFSADDKLTQKAIKYKKWYLANTVRE